MSFKMEIKLAYFIGISYVKTEDVRELVLNIYADLIRNNSICKEEWERVNRVLTNIADQLNELEETE